MLLAVPDEALEEFVRRYREKEARPVVDGLIESARIDEEAKAA